MIAYVPQDWGKEVEPTKRRAMELYNLRKLGWKGFDELDWVAALLKKHISIRVILVATLSFAQASFDALQELADDMSDEDRHRMRDYIVGKLALEELSCMANGAGAGACQTRTALTRCVEIALTWK